MNQPSPTKSTNIDISSATGGRLRNEPYIHALDAEQNVELLNQNEERRDEFEKAYGRDQFLEELPSKRACRMTDYHENANVTDVDRFDESIDWSL